jgi:P-type Cu+ transporter
VASSYNNASIDTLGLRPAGVALEAHDASAPAEVEATCFHCGLPCADTRFAEGTKRFCCQGCLIVHELLNESGLGQFYELSQHPGVRIGRTSPLAKWAYLDEPTVQQRLLDFTDGKIGRVTFHVPAIHCVACVWLLENLFRLRQGIGKSQVNFPRREVSIQFAIEQISLSGVAELLASIGYEPQLTLATLEKPKPNPARKKQWLQMGVAGFAFGNIMLFSFPAYLGLDHSGAAGLRLLFGYLSLALAAPVVVFSASDYWRSALVSLRQRVMTLDIPIALGLAALYARSAFEIISGQGAGYLDSLAGLVFFLLCGRVFQQKTHERMAFDRDYKCFFPLSVMRVTGSGEESVALSSLRVGDRLRLRNRELVPADARLLSEAALIDYSFVTGESEPVAKQAGDYLYAGGQAVGGVVEVETVKPVSQSHLASLWDHETFRKERDHNLNTLTNRFSRRFTLIVIAIAVGAGLVWAVAGDGRRGLQAFTSVLIVACPCALALAGPFALGTAQRLLARSSVFLKNAMVLERMSQVNTIVFDKTGTLTAPQADDVVFQAAPGTGHLSAPEASWIGAVVSQSTHPHAMRIAESLSGQRASAPASEFAEVAGCGLVGGVQGREIRVGSRAWLEAGGVVLPETPATLGSATFVAIDGNYRGVFNQNHRLRPETDRLLSELSRRHELALLTGDNEKERERFAGLFGPKARLHFNQSPFDKLGFIRALQESRQNVMMVGDGLNDAGALRQSDIGVAVVEQIGTFSPASDVILEAGQVPRLGRILALARRTVRIVRWSFGISAAYNVVGISIAAAGKLSPLACAVLMPLSSVSVVLFACGAVNWASRKAGLKS